MMLASWTKEKEIHYLMPYTLQKHFLGSLVFLLAILQTCPCYYNRIGFIISPRARIPVTSILYHEIGLTVKKKIQTISFAFWPRGTLIPQDFRADVEAKGILGLFQKYRKRDN
jgi:hypothetical protein